jgi:hypothetical protein
MSVSSLVLFSARDTVPPKALKKFLPKAMANEFSSDGSFALPFIPLADEATVATGDIISLISTLILL